MESAVNTGLVLQGGGARGAYQVGVMCALAEITGETVNPFPIISGTSVGAINAASLASNATNFQKATQKLEDLWLNLKTDSVFDPRLSSVVSTMWRVVRTFGFGAKSSQYGWLDNRPLRELLNREFSREGLDAAYASGALESFCITTSCYACGVAVTHFEGSNKAEEWMRSRREGLHAKISVDHLMASSALPFLFPAVKIGNTYHGDGALRLNAPLSPVIRMGADKVLVIGVRDAQVSEIGDEETVRYPSMGEMSGHSLDILFNDNLDSDVERVRRINRLLTFVDEDQLEETGLRKIDLLMLQPSQDLREIASRHEHEMPKVIRSLVNKSGAGGTDGRLPSYLLFEQGFIRELIALGKSDTLKRKDEIEQFFAL